MIFTYTIKDKQYEVKGITFDDLKKLQLLLEISDNKQILKYIDSLIITENCNFLEKAILILYSYLLTVDSKIDFNLKKNKDKYKASIFIDSIIKKLEGVYVEDVKLDISKDSYIILGLPSDFFIYDEKNINDDINFYKTYRFIKRIVIENEEVPVLDEIISELPVNIIKPMENYINIWSENFKNIKFIDGEESSNCHIVTLLEYIKKILSINYKELINIEYHLFRYIRITNYHSITLQEAKALISTFNEDMVYQEEQANANTQQTNGFNVK